MFTNDSYYGWQWMGQQWERSLFCQFQLLGSYWEVHWLKLAPGLKKVTWGKTTPRNIFFRHILPNFDNGIEVGDDDFGGCSMLPVCKTGIGWQWWEEFWDGLAMIWRSGNDMEIRWHWSLPKRITARNQIKTQQGGNTSQPRVIGLARHGQGWNAWQWTTGDRFTRALG